MLGKLRAISSRAFSINVTFTQHTNLTIQRTTIPKPKPALDETLKFGTVTTDHMLEIDWNAREGWKQPQILPFRNFSISPCASVFHYANACFEGLKAYKSAQGDILMYRPMKNMERLHNSMVSLALPEFDKEEFLKCIE